MSAKNTKGARRRAGSKQDRLDHFLEQVNLNAAGIDVGASHHLVAVPTDRAPQPIQKFAAHTSELQRLANWLTGCGIDTVAMESTGIYWVPLYELLEARGFKVVLANARYVKNVPGRKTDVADCQWIQQLHTFGLLSSSFRPASEIVALRSLVRHREKLTQEGAAYIQRMQKALALMNIQLRRVLTDIKGATGIAIIRDIVAGHTDPHYLVRHRDKRCKASREEMIEALTGHYRPEQVFVLRQNLDMYDHIRSTIIECDKEIERLLGDLKTKSDPPDEPLPRRRQRRPTPNAPDFDLRSPLHWLCGGIDLTQVPGIGPLGALNLLAEIGTDMSAWPTARHFASWLSLAPQNRVSGGRLLSSKTASSANRAAATLRMAVIANARSDNALAAFYRRLAVRIGSPKAITAAARKLATIIYLMLKRGETYREPGAAAYNHQQTVRRLNRIAKNAAELGFMLVPKQQTPQSVGEVS
jgi:transposase